MFRAFAYLMLLLLSACGSLAQKVAMPPDTLVRLADDEVKGLDPQKVSDLASLRVALDQFEGLMRMSSGGVAEPGLADAPHISADGLIWRFQLKSDVRFSDGTPITAQVFADVFARLRTKETASPTASLFDAIDSVQASSAHNVVVRLKSPYPALGELLAHPALAALPLHKMDWANARPMVTSGAYRLTLWALNDRIELSANPMWHDGAPKQAKLIWRPMSDQLSAMRLFQAGGAHVTGDFPSARLARLNAEMPESVHVSPYRGTYYFAFNTRRPPFDDVRVRRALGMSIEREWIAGPLMAVGTLPAWGIVPPGIGGLPDYRPDWARWPRARRLAAARALLKLAGYGADHPLSFEIRFNSDVDHRRVSVALAAMWRPLGVEAKLFNSESSLHFASLRRADFALARSGWIGDVSAPENFLSVHKSDAGPINYSGYANPNYDEKLVLAGNIADPVKRALAMRAAEAIAMRDMPVLPIYFYVARALVSPRVGGWVDNPANVHPSRTLSVR